MQKFIPVEYSSLHANSVCELNTYIKSVGSVKIHFEAWSNHLSSNNTYLPCQEHMRLKRLCFEGYFSHGGA